MKQMIYLDNAATTFPKPDMVYDTMDRFSRNGAVNAGRGSYTLARQASMLISETKENIRKLVHADMNVPVIFAPSITVALNQIIQGYNWQEYEYVYVSPYEHNAVARTLNLVASQYKLNIRELPLVPSGGAIDIEKIKYIFSKEVFAEGKKYSCLTVLDTAQSLGLIEYNAHTQKNIDILAFAGHKCLYGPFGIGGFINYGHIPLKEFIVGGTGSDTLNLNMPMGEESKYESASSNLPSIVGLNAALMNLNVPECFRHEKELTDYLKQELSKIDGVILFIPQEGNKHIGIVSFAINGMKSEDIGMILDEDYGIAVRTGYHCAPFIHKYLKDEKYLGTVRVGLSQFTKKEDLDVLLRAIKEI